MVGEMSDSRAATYCLQDIIVKKVWEPMGPSWKADLKTLWIKQNQGNFR